MLLNKYEHAPCDGCPNYYLIPVTIFDTTDKGADDFNEVYFYIKERAKRQGWHDIVRAPKGGISTSRDNYHGNMWDIKPKKNSIELTVVCFDGRWRFQFRTGECVNIDGKKFSGTKAYHKFRDICTNMGVDLESFKIDNGEEIKKQIPAPYIALANDSYKDQIWEHAHHIDLNSSFMSGIAESFTELRPPIQHIYDQRKEKGDTYKAILTHTYGYCQSEYCKTVDGNSYALAHLSKAALEYNNRELDRLTEGLKANGCTPILYNTDGIWYSGPLYHDEREGKDLGEWKHDHTNCRLRIKTRGSYEFLEDGVYHPVVRGYTQLDKVKSRSEWDWGSIYMLGADKVIKYMFSYEYGIIKGEDYAE